MAQHQDNVSVVVTYLDQEKSFDLPRRVLESENGMVKIRERVEDVFGVDDDEFVDKLDDESIRIRRYSDSECSVENDDIVDKLENMDNDGDNKIKFKLKVVSNDENDKQANEKNESKNNFGHKISKKRKNKNVKDNEHVYHPAPVGDGNSRDPSPVHENQRDVQPVIGTANHRDSVGAASPPKKGAALVVSGNGNNDDDQDSGWDEDMEIDVLSAALAHEITLETPINVECAAVKNEWDNDTYNIKCSWNYDKELKRKMENNDVNCKKLKMEINCVNDENKEDFVHVINGLLPKQQTNEIQTTFIWQRKFTPDSTYHIRLRIVDGSNKLKTSKYSEFVSLTIPKLASLKAPQYLCVKRIFPGKILLSWKPGFIVKQNQLIVYHIKELNHHKQHPFMAFVNHDNKKASDANTDCWIRNLKENTNYTFQVYAQDQQTKEESSLSKALNVKIPNFNNLQEPGVVKKIEWLYDKSKNKIALYWDPPSNISNIVTYNVYENGKESAVEEFPVYVDAPNDNKKLHIEVVTTVLVRGDQDGFKPWRSGRCEPLIIDGKFGDEPHDEQQGQQAQPAPPAQPPPAPPGQQPHDNEGILAQNEVSGECEEEHEPQPGVFWLHIKNIHSGKFSCFEFTERTNFDEIKDAVLKDKEKLQISNQLDFDKARFSALANNDSVSITFDERNFQTEMLDDFLEKSTTTCLLGWDAVVPEIRDVEVSRADPGTLVVNYSSSAANDILMYELEGSQPINTMADAAHTIVNAVGAQIGYNKNDHCKTGEIRDKNKSSYSFEDLTIGKEYRIRLGSRNDISVENSYNWCKWSKWYKIVDIADDLFKQESEQSRAYAKSQIHKESGDNAVILALNNVKDVIIWGLQKGKNWRGHFFLLVQGCDGRIPLRDIRHNTVDPIYHGQISLSEKDLKNQKTAGGVFFQIAMIDLNKTKKRAKQHIVSAGDCYPKTRNQKQNLWKISEQHGYFILDFRPYHKSKYTLKQRKSFYSDCLTVTFDHLFKKCNSEIGPSRVMRIIDDCRRRINMECSTYIDHKQKRRFNHNEVSAWNSSIANLIHHRIKYQNLTTWDKLIPHLTLLFIGALLPQTHMHENKTTFWVKAQTAYGIYQQVVNGRESDRLGGIEMICRQIERLVGSNIYPIQKSFEEYVIAVSNSKNVNVNKYCYALWLNILYQSMSNKVNNDNENKEAEENEKRIENVRNKLTRQKFTLNGKSCDKLYEAIKNELSLGLDARPVPLEIVAIAEFIDPKFCGKYYKYFFDVCRSIEDVDTLYQVLSNNKKNVTAEMTRDLSFGDKLMPLILQKCELTPNPNLDRGKYTFENTSVKHIVDLCADLIASCVQTAALYAGNDTAVNNLAGILSDYGYCLLNSSIKQCIARSIMKNRNLVSSELFVGFYSHLIDGNDKQQESVNQLNKCFEIWCTELEHKIVDCIDIIDKHKLSWKLLNQFIINCNEDRKHRGVIEKMMVIDLKRKCELLQHEMLVQEVKRIIGKHIRCYWVEISDQERECICNVCLWLLEQGMVDICDTITKTVMISGEYRLYPFIGDDIQIIENYFCQSHALLFIDFLIKLKQCDDRHKMLDIMDRLSTFVKFWQKILNNIATKQTQSALLDLLNTYIGPVNDENIRGDGNQKTVFDTIHVRFEKAGGFGTERKRRETMNKVSESKQRHGKLNVLKDGLKTFCQLVGPQSRYCDKNIRRLIQLNDELNGSSEISLSAMSEKSQLAEQLMNANEQVSRLFDNVKRNSNSKIWMSIWQRLILNQIAEWSQVVLSQMDSYQVVTWIRGNCNKILDELDGFDLDVLVQLVIDKEIDGQQLQSNDLDLKKTIEKWNNEQFDRYRDRMAADIPHIDKDDIDDLCMVLTSMVEKKKARDNKYGQLTQQEKQFTFDRLIEINSKTNDRARILVSDIVENRLDMAKIESHLSMLRNEQMRTIRNEIDSIVKQFTQKVDRQVYDQISEISNNVFDVFTMLDSIENQLLIRDCVGLLHVLSKQYFKQKEMKRDESWKNVFNIINNLQKNKTISLTQMTTIFNENKTLVRLELSDLKKSLIRLIASNRKVLSDLLSQFLDDKKFAQHLEKFEDSDPIQQERIKYLTTARTLMIDLLSTSEEPKKELKKDLTCTKMKEKLVNIFEKKANKKNDKQYTENKEKETREDDEGQTELELNVKALQNVTKSWHLLLEGTLDPMAHKLKRDKVILDQIESFVFGNEADSIEALRKQEIVYKDDTSNYLSVKLSNGEIMSQNEVDEFTDRLLMYITGNSRSIAAITRSTSFSNLSEKKICSLFHSVFRSKLNKVGLKRYIDLETIIYKNKITGDKLVTAANQCVDGIEPMKKLFTFDGNEYALVNPANNEDLNIDGSEMNDTVGDPQSTNDKIVNELTKIVQFALLREKVQEELIPKLDLAKKIGSKRLIYYAKGGRSELANRRTLRINRTGIAHFEQLNLNWDSIVSNWKQSIDKLRDTYRVLSFFTVNDMRFICNEIKQYLVTGHGSKKQSFLTNLTNKLSLINRTIDSEDVDQFLDGMQQAQHEEVKTGDGLNDENATDAVLFRLGHALTKIFGKRICHPTSLDNKARPKFLLAGRPHVYVTPQEWVLDTVLKLFISQNQQPEASRVIFCNENTTVEHVECLLRRACIKKMGHQAKSILHCLVQPEKLSFDIVGDVIRVMRKYMFHNGCLLAVITSSKRNRIYEQLMSFDDVRETLNESERIKFFESILESDLEKFHAKQNEKPLCAVFLSQRECVGKSYVISKQAKDNGHTLCHIPINTKTVDVDFVVDRLLSVNNGQDNHENKDDRIVYHINVSSDAGIDVNVVMFKLLVLGYLTKSTGESFNVTNKHGFFVEFPSKLSRLVNTSIKDVQTQFSFLAGLGNRSKGIRKIEVVDSLQPEQYLLFDDKNSLWSNELELTEKEHFVLKYLDAYDKGLLTITGKGENNWDYTKHIVVDDNRRKKLILKYCERGLDSLVFLKSYLRYMYRQLLQLYNAYILVDNNFAVNIDELAVTATYIQYHRLIARSTAESAQYIACHMYKIEDYNEMKHRREIESEQARRKKVTTKESKHEEKDDIKADDAIEETTGEEKFFLVDYWSNADPPMVVLNQRPIQESKQVNMHSTTLSEDMTEAYANSTSDFSILAKDLTNSNHVDSKEWQKFVEINSVGKKLKIDLYNFDDIHKEKQQSQRRFSRNVKNNKPMKTAVKDQKQKLRLLLRICGGFTTSDPKAQAQRVDEIYNDPKNKGYALTFDNILKIVAIFFRIKSGIPLLIMGETGCGKTRLLQYMADVLNIKMECIDVHGGYTVNDLKQDLKNPLKMANENPNATILVFLDEVNTSAEVGAFKEVICDHSLDGNEFPDNLVIVAALNPYRARSESEQEENENKEAEKNNPKHFKDDLDREMSKLVYTVHPLPPSLKTYVWNFGALAESDERQYISVMTCATWDDSSFKKQVAHTKQFDALKLLFIDLICLSQHFLRKHLRDVSVCSLRDAKRCNRFFVWFFQRKHRKNKMADLRLKESIILSIAQCYYFRLNKEHRDMFAELIDKSGKNARLNYNFADTLEIEKMYYVEQLNHDRGIALNHAFCENLYVMLVSLATKTPVIVVGKPGSSKTLAMTTLQNNLSSVTKNKTLTDWGFDDYVVVSFQCSKLTTAAQIKRRWDYAVERDKTEKKDSRSTKKSIGKTVIMFFDEVGLAEQSPHRPLKVLHKLLEDPEIPFVGLSNWKLDSAKMNRVVLHRVLPPTTEDLEKTAREIMKNSGEYTQIADEIEDRLPVIAGVYESILKDMKDAVLHNNSKKSEVDATTNRRFPLNFYFYGHRDFYSLISYLTYRLHEPGVSLNEDDYVVVDAVLRNFGGLTKEDAENFLFYKIRRKILDDDTFLDNETIWKHCSPLKLVQDNIKQRRDTHRAKNSHRQIRNIMLITDSPILWKILFDSGIIRHGNTEVIFGSKFVNDNDSAVYMYRTLERVKNAMKNGDVCLLQDLTQLYDSLYDVLNQRYLEIDGKKYCRICIGGESIRCPIEDSFRCIVVSSRRDAHHVDMNAIDSHVPVAFLNRFEKQYLDSSLLEKNGVGIGDDAQSWTEKRLQLDNKINKLFDDHKLKLKDDVFVGYDATYSKISALIAQNTKYSEYTHVDPYDEDLGFGNEADEVDEVKDTIDERVDYSVGMLLKATHLKYLIQDRKKLRTKYFQPYADLLDLLEREGSHHHTNAKLLRVITHDTYQLPKDFNYKNPENKGSNMTVVNETRDGMKNKENNDIGENGGKIHFIKFRELHTFVREIDFLNYVEDFFSDSNNVATTLIIQCESVCNTSQKLMHYLHAQHVIEKASASYSMRRMRRETDVDKLRRKTAIFLVYMNRYTKEYPLIFNSDWEHVFIDSLLPANHASSQQIQINDLNAYDAKSDETFNERVMNQIGRLCQISFQRAMNCIECSEEHEKNISAIEDLLKTNSKDQGQFSYMLHKRLESVVNDDECGAVQCLKTVLESNLEARGSLRTSVMNALRETIKKQLAQVICILLGNNNINLYKHDGEDKKLIKFWLQLISEARIVKISNFKIQKDGQVQPENILNNSQFPFSTFVHNYLLSFKSEAIKQYRSEHDRPVEISGMEGLSAIVPEFENLLNVVNLNVNINNMPAHLVKALTFDIVRLESSKLGIDSENENLINAVVGFLWIVSNNYYQANVARGGKKRKKTGFQDDIKQNIDEINGDDSTDDENDEYNYQFVDIEDEVDGDDQDEMKIADETDVSVQTDGTHNDKQEKVDDHERDEDDKKDNANLVGFEEVEEHNVQIIQIYSALWSYERLISQFLNVLFCLTDVAQLKQIIEQWQNVNRDITSCLGSIMVKLLRELNDKLRNIEDVEKLSQKITLLLSKQTSFEYILNYLSEFNYQNINELKKQWLMIRLELLCGNVCPKIGGQFIHNQIRNFGDHKFHSLPKLKILLSELLEYTKDNDDGDSSIQWVIQNFMVYFAFNAPKMDKDFELFIGDLIDVISCDKERELKNKCEEHFGAGIVINLFTRFEILDRILHLILDKNKNNIKGKLETCIQEKESMNSLICSLVVSIQERRLHNAWQEKYNDEHKPELPPPALVKQTVAKLDDSLKGTRFDQLLAIADAKVLIFRFLIWLQASKFILTDKGIVNSKKKRVQIGLRYMKQLGYLFASGAGATVTEHEIRRGLQFYFFCNLSRRLGLQKSLRLCQESPYTKILNISVIETSKIKLAKEIAQNPEKKENECVPQDDTFALLRFGVTDENDVKLSDLYYSIDSAIRRSIKESVDLTKLWVKPNGNEFSQEYFVHVIAGVFKYGYLKNGIKNKLCVMNFVQKNLNNCKSTMKSTSRIETMIRQLLQNEFGIHNDKHGKLKLNVNKSTLENVQLIRLQWHIIGVLLSLPRNPLNTLLHNPRSFIKRYLVGMPEFQGNDLLTGMNNSGVWLCPNDHMYFIAPCGWPSESSKCRVCGASTGNKQGAPPHTPADGNRRLGEIDGNGNFKAGWHDPYENDKEVPHAELDAETMTPKGYVYVTRDDTPCRVFSGVTIRIMRLIINIILIMHDSVRDKSQINEHFTAIYEFGKGNHCKGLKKECDRYLKEISKQLGNISQENVIYLLHGIIHNFYLKFVSKYGKKGCDGTKLDTRAEFEKWFVNECMNPILRDPNAMIAQIATRSMKNPLMKYWAPRINEQIDAMNLNSKQNDQGDEKKQDVENKEYATFAKRHLVHLQLPFTIVTLPMICNLITQHKDNLKDKYPTVCGIFGTLNESVGYSLFALKYLPSMITWMKLIHSKFNRRLTIKDVTEKGDVYHCEYVLNECKNNTWGDLKYWQNALDGFVKGWNHLAERVTTNTDLEHREMNENESENESEDDGKDEVKEVEVKLNKNGSNDVNDEINPLKKYVILRNVCQNIDIDVIESNNAGAVPISYALDCGVNSDIGTSVQIRLIMDHYFGVNNQLLRQVYQVDDNNVLKKQLGGCMTNLQISKASDVVDIEEQVLQKMVQQCYQQRCRYGLDKRNKSKEEEYKVDVGKLLNLQLLESRLRERYIAGRKIIKYESITYEFGGQHIAEAIAKIEITKQKIDDKNVKYFEDAAVEELQRIKEETIGKFRMNLDNTNDNNNDNKINNNNNNNANVNLKNIRMESIGKCKESVEQAIIALSNKNESNLPDNGNSVGEYMKDSLHLFGQDYEVFMHLQFKLKHLDSIWNYLNRLYLLEEGKWREVPDNILDIYEKPLINEEYKKLIQQFIDKEDMQLLWKFLVRFRMFLQEHCGDHLFGGPPKDDPSLKIYLEAAGIEESLIEKWPDEIQLSLCGDAYHHAATFYSERVEREEREGKRGVYN